MKVLIHVVQLIPVVHVVTKGFLVVRLVHVINFSDIINNYWTRLSQNIVICQCLADQLFAEAEGCFIIRSPSLFFLMNILGKRSDLPFSRKSDRKKEKSTVSITHEQNIICSQTVGWHCARVQVVPHFFLRDSRASETRASVKITPREKGETRWEREK